MQTLIYVLAIFGVFSLGVTAIFGWWMWQNRHPKGETYSEWRTRRGRERLAALR